MSDAARRSRAGTPAPTPAGAEAHEDHPYRRVGLTWLALILLMLATLGGAYLPLGRGNLALGLGIAAAKAALVLVVFMRVLQVGTMARVAAAVSVALWVLLAALSGVDYSARHDAPLPVQPPQIVPPLRD